MTLYEPNWQQHIKKDQNADTFRIFSIHVRKSGGTCAKERLRLHFPLLDVDGYEDARSHKYYEDALNIANSIETWNPENGLFYSVVRNPYSWLVSNFFWFDAFQSHYNRFEEFAIDWIEAPDRLPLPWVDPPAQEYFAKALPKGIFIQLFENENPGARCQIPVIIRCERLKEGLNILQGQFGIPPQKLEVYNRSTHRKHDYKHYYERDPELGPIIKKGLFKKHEREFKMFGYEFDGPTDDNIFIDPKSLILNYK